MVPSLEIPTAAKLLFPSLWLLSLALLLSTDPLPAKAEGNWPRWRGPLENGHSLDQHLPIQWDRTHIRWKTALTGQGQSSPVIWNEKVFLTSARNEGRQRVVLCFDRSNGTLLWERTAWTGDSGLTHLTNGHASATCVTDGEFLYAFFGMGGLHCYTTDGQHVWSRDLGNFTGPWGTASSPVLVGNMVIQNCDADANSYLIAMNKLTGETIWQTTRDDFRGWSTPILIASDHSAGELVLNGHSGVRAYDPQNGMELWLCKSFEGRGTPTVTLANGLLHVVNGLRGDIYAIRLGGQGDVTETHIAWHSFRRSRDIASPIIIGNYMLVMSMRGGILANYSSDNGQELWKQRIGTTAHFFASPIAYQGLAFFLSEEGETFVVKPGDALETVARNPVRTNENELFRASIAPSNGQLFMRSDQFLYCIGTRSNKR